MGPKFRDWCPYKECTQREVSPCERTQDRNWSYVAISQEYVGPPDAGRGKKGFFPIAFRGSMAMMTPWF